MLRRVGFWNNNNPIISLNKSHKLLNILWQKILENFVKPCSTNCLKNIYKISKIFKNIISSNCPKNARLLFQMQFNVILFSIRLSTHTIEHWFGTVFCNATFLEINLQLKIGRTDLSKT